MRLLRLFETMYRTRNISQAADALGTSQPSVSLSLNRLRQHFGDSLFVHIGAKMQLTPRVAELIEGIRSILSVASDHFIRRAPFDPAISDRLFTIHMTDPAETILMPRLVDRLARTAPAIGLRVRPVDGSSQSTLIDGQVDLILGYLDREAEGLYRCTLHDEHYVCIACADHPQIGRNLSLEQFKSEVTLLHGPGMRVQLPQPRL